MPLLLLGFVGLARMVADARARQAEAEHLHLVTWRISATWCQLDQSARERLRELLSVLATAEQASDDPRWLAQLTRCRAAHAPRAQVTT